MNSKSQIVMTVALVGSVFLAPGAAAQALPAELKNIQVLKNMPAPELTETMGFIASSLGVTCNHCHLGPWESDTQKAKLTAREMIRMTREINERAFGGRTEVTCYTCHQAHAKPGNTPPLWNKTPDEIAAIKKERQAQAANASAAGGAKAATPPASTSNSSEPLKDAAEILADYRKAVGGSEVKTVAMKGTMSADLGSPTPVEINIGFPDKYYQAMNAGGTPVQQAVNGDRGWAITPGRTIAYPPSTVAQAKQIIGLFRAVKFEDADAARKTTAIEKIGDRAYFVVESVTDRRLERLYFDTQTGLLYKRYFEGRTTLGSNRNEVQFEDYRDVNGVKLPYHITSISTNDRSRFAFTEIQTNVTLDPARFVMPATLAGK